MAFNLTEDHVKALEQSGFRDVKSWREVRDDYPTLDGDGRYPIFAGRSETRDALNSFPDGVVATFDLTVYWRTPDPPHFPAEWHHTHKNMEVLVLYGQDKSRYDSDVYAFTNEIMCTNARDHDTPRFVNANFGWDRDVRSPRFCIQGDRANQVLLLGVKNRWPEAFNILRATCAPIRSSREYAAYYGINNIHLCRNCGGWFKVPEGQHINHHRCCICRRPVCSHCIVDAEKRSAKIRAQYSPKIASKFIKRVGPLCIGCS